MLSKQLCVFLQAAALVRNVGAATQGTIITERSVSSDVAADISGFSPECNFDGELTISHPMSMNENDKFFSTGQLQLKAIEMIVDYVNVKRCGVRLSGGHYSIKLKTYGDDSSNDKTEAIASFTKNETDFFVGPYSSGLTGKLAPIVQDNNNILIAGECLYYLCLRFDPSQYYRITLYFCQAALHQQVYSVTEMEYLEPFHQQINTWLKL